MNRIKRIYKALHSSFGPQGWWPVAGRYHPGDYSYPKTPQQQWEIVAGAILAQNTSWKNAAAAIGELRRKRKLTVAAMAKMPQQKLAAMIRSSGYYNEKAKKLKIVAKHVIDNYDGKIQRLLKKRTQQLRKELLSLHGIGPETADSILLYAARKPVFVIDAYTRRIMQRIGYDQHSYEELQQLFERNLSRSEKIYNEFHALLVELGKNTCTKNNPECRNCPLLPLCSHGKSVMKQKV